MLVLRKTISTIVVFVLTFLVISCTGFPYGDFIKENSNTLHKNYPNVTRSLDYDGRNLTYLYQPNDKSRWLVVFVHGSPGSAEAFAHFLTDKTLLNQYAMLSVTRPGFEPKNNAGPERSLKKQSAAINAVINQHKADKDIVLIGHSFGGPVIAKMAIDYPKQYKKLVMLAASVNPDLEKTKWFQIPANWPILRWLVPNSLDTSNQEILALKAELTKMKTDIGKTNPDIYIIHGMKDELVPVGNVDYMKKMYADNINKTVLLENTNHFIVWSHPADIMDAIFYFTKE